MLGMLLNPQQTIRKVNKKLYIVQYYNLFCTLELAVTDLATLAVKSCVLLS